MTSTAPPPSGAEQPRAHAASHPPQRPGAPSGQRPGTVHPPGTDAVTDLGAALTWMWTTFTRHLTVFLVPGIVYGILYLGLMALMLLAYFGTLAGLLGSSTPPTDDQVLRTTLLASGAMLAVVPFLGIVGILWSSGATRAATIASRGGTPTLGQGFIGDGRTVGTLLLVHVLTLLGSLLCYLPGLLIAVGCLYAPAAAARGARPLEAIRESVDLVRAKPGLSLLALLVAVSAASIAGMLVVTIVVLPPLTALFTVGCLVRAQGRELPAAGAPAPRGA